LKEAVTADAHAMVSEIGPSDGEEAERSQSRSTRRSGAGILSDCRLDRPQCGGVVGGIAGKLSVMDDAGRSAVSLPGDSTEHLAGKAMFAPGALVWSAGDAQALFS
jgi:hypothetical protein